MLLWERGDEMLRDIFVGVVVNLLTVGVPAVTWFMLYTAVYYVRRSDFMKDVRRYLRPCDRVIKWDGSVIGYEEAPTEFVRVLTLEEQEKILARGAKGKTLFNGDCVRLDSVQGGVAKLSRVKFFDFMTTNLVVKPASRGKQNVLEYLQEYLEDNEVREIRKLERRVTRVTGGQEKKTFEDVLAIRELANILTVSVVIEDCTGRVLLVKRGNKVAIASGNFATTCAGSVAVEDLEQGDPILSCAQRELEEELGLKCKLKIDCLVISKQKLQPAALCIGKIEEKFEDVVETMKNARDFNEENCAVFAVPREQLAGVVKHYQFTDVAAFQLTGDVINWWSVKPVDIGRFRLEV